MTEKPWYKYVEQAEHYIAIGSVQHVINPTATGLLDLPWEFATNVEWTIYDNYIGDLYVAATHPCGLTFQWYMKPVVWNSDHQSEGYHADSEVLQYLMRLPDTLRPKLGSLLQKAMQVITVNEQRLTNVAYRNRLARGLLGYLTENGNVPTEYEAITWATAH